MEQLPEVLPTVDPELGTLVHAQLADHGVEVLTGTDGPLDQPVNRRAGRAAARRGDDGGRPGGHAVPSTWSWSSSGSAPTPSWPPRPAPPSGTGARSPSTATCGPTCLDVFAAGDCVVTHHRLLGETYLPLGTTAHKQGRVAGENALGGSREFAGQPRHPGRQDLRPRRRPHRAARPRGRRGGFDPVTVASEADDHKAYYPGSHRIAMRFTGDRQHRPAARASSCSATGTPRSPSASTSPPPPSSTG